MNIETRIALFAGGDLDDHECGEVERRLAGCPDARDCHAEMERSLAVLHECREARLREADGRSLWPRIATRLPRQRRPGPIESLRPWVPALTVAALVLALATVATAPPKAAVPFAGAWPADGEAPRGVRPQGFGALNSVVDEGRIELPPNAVYPGTSPQHDEGAESDAHPNRFPYHGGQGRGLWSPQVQTN